MKASGAGKIYHKKTEKSRPGNERRNSDRKNKKITTEKSYSICATYETDSLPAR